MLREDRARPNSRENKTGIVCLLQGQAIILFIYQDLPFKTPKHIKTYNETNQGSPKPRELCASLCEQRVKSHFYIPQHLQRLIS